MTYRLILMSSTMVLSSLALIACAVENLKPTDSPLVQEIIKELPADAEPLLKVAVIDTGFDEKAIKDVNFLCKGGSHDFTGTGLNDKHGHGTHIAFLIDQYAKNLPWHAEGEAQYLNEKEAKFENIAKSMKVKIPYCQMILKYYDPKFNEDGILNLDRMRHALAWAIDHGANVINISGGGAAPNEDEYRLIEEALNKGIKVIVAAGNENTNIGSYYLSQVVYVPEGGRGFPISFYGKFYPAAYDPRITVVGALMHDKVHRTKQTNTGDIINEWELGTNVYSRIPEGYAYMSGTSQATAIATGKYVERTLRYNKK